MKRLSTVSASLCLALAASSASAFVFTLTPVTNTTPTFAGTILIQGSVTVAPTETFYSPNQISTVNLPFLANFSAGFNGSGQTWDPAFLAWNGVGTYTGPIYNHLISTNNLGYAGGMPQGLYGSNIFGPGGQSSIILSYADSTGATRSLAATYAISVVPAPSAAGALALSAFTLQRRRRN